MDKDSYIKKLEKRIHNQRVALRQNWMLMEERAEYRKHYRVPQWLRIAMARGKELRELKALKG